MARFNRVLLVQLLHHEGPLKGTDPFISAGLGYIAESLVEEGIRYDYFDICFGNTKRLIRKIEEFEPDLVGIRMLTFLYKKNYAIIKTIKEKFKDIQIAIGGPHISTMREKVLEECEQIDFGVVLEGEKTIIELCNGKELNAIKGLIYRENRFIRYTGDRGFIGDLNDVSYPKYRKFPLGKYFTSVNTPIPIVTSRGCPYKCTYCPVAMAIGSGFRARQAGEVVDELEYWYLKGHLTFSILDDNFSLVKRRVYEICDHIEKRKLKGLRITCGNGVRADKVDRKLLQRMKKVGFIHLSFGVEAASNNVLNMLKKGEDIADIEKAIRIACDLGFSVELFFMVGSPKESWQDIEDSVKLALRYPITNVKFFNIVPYPNTELYAWVKKNDYLVRNPEVYLNRSSIHDKKPLFYTPELSISDRKKALRYTRKVTKLIKKREYRYKFNRCGIFGEILSRLAVSDLVENKLMANPHTRSLLRGFGRMLTGSKIP